MPANGPIADRLPDEQRRVSTSIVTIWCARIAWLLAAVLGGRAIGGALTDRSDLASITVQVAAWSGWAVVLLALAIPSTVSLTAARLGTPVGAVVAIVAASLGASTADASLLAVPALVAAVATFAADFGRAFVQASAYGDEQRFPLRSPAAAGLAAGIAWVVWAGVSIATVLTLAAGNWIAGLPGAGLAIGLGVVLAPRWHRLSRRWLVLVPAGLVLHDPLVLTDTIMLRTNAVSGVRLAPADTQAADLTGPATGHVVEVTSTETVTTVFSPTPAEPDGRAIHMTTFLCAPSRPGAALAAAARRGLPVR